MLVVPLVFWRRQLLSEIDCTVERFRSIVRLPLLGIEGLCHLSFGDTSFHLKQTSWLSDLVHNCITVRFLLQFSVAIFSLWHSRRSVCDAIRHCPVIASSSKMADVISYMTSEE